MKSKGLSIRPARPGDESSIRELIEELAGYEKLRHEAVATDELIATALFRDKPDAEVIIVEWDGDIAGFALFFHNFSTFLGQRGIHLEDLFVRPQYRGKGLGQALLKRLATIAIERHCGRLEWNVLDWNKPAIGFYRSLGATPMDGWTTFRLSGQALIDNA